MSYGVHPFEALASEETRHLDGYELQGLVEACGGHFLQTRPSSHSSFRWQIEPRGRRSRPPRQLANVCDATKRTAATSNQVQGVLSIDSKTITRRGPRPHRGYR